jgi:hypothetical protein
MLEVFNCERGILMLNEPVIWSVCIAIGIDLFGLACCRGVYYDPILAAHAASQADPNYRLQVFSNSSAHSRAQPSTIFSITPPKTVPIFDLFLIFFSFSTCTSPSLHFAGTTQNSWKLTISGVVSVVYMIFP